MNMIENQVMKRSLFKDESALELSYIPKKILYRDAEINLLSGIFYNVLEKPFSISRKVIFQGPVGVGKTLTTKVFIKKLEESILIRKLNYKTIHINCRQSGTALIILGMILNRLGKNIKPRGMSPEELFLELVKILKEEKIYLILILDELHYINEGKFPLIYSLSRISEHTSDGNQYISIIGLMRNIALTGVLDASTQSTLQENVITFHKYSKQQIYEILDQRIQIGISEGTLKPDLIEFISLIVERTGDIRKGLNIIKNSVLISETYDRKEVIITDIAKACNMEPDSMNKDVFDQFSRSEILMLLALINMFVKINSFRNKFKNFYKTYTINSIDFKLNKLDESECLHILQKFEKSGFLKIHVEKEKEIGEFEIHLENPAIIECITIFQDILKH